MKPSCGRRRRPKNQPRTDSWSLDQFEDDDDLDFSKLNDDAVLQGVAVGEKQRSAVAVPVRVVKEASCLAVGSTSTQKSLNRAMPTAALTGGKRRNANVDVMTSNKSRKKSRKERKEQKKRKRVSMETRPEEGESDASDESPVVTVAKKDSASSPQAAAHVRASSSSLVADAGISTVASTVTKQRSNTGDVAALLGTGAKATHILKESAASSNRYPLVGASTMNDQKRVLEKPRRNSKASPSETETDFLTGKDSEEVLLVYPFGIDEQKIDDAAAGLEELLIPEPSAEITASNADLVTLESSSEKEGKAEDPNVKTKDASRKESHAILTFNVSTFKLLKPKGRLNDTLIDFWFQM